MQPAVQGKSLPARGSRSRRARCHRDDLSSERPLFFHPGIDDPAWILGFREEYLFPIEGSFRGETTIASLGLNRELLAKVRRDASCGLQALVDSRDSDRRETLTSGRSRSWIEEMLTRLDSQIAVHLRDSAEYAAMHRASLCLAGGPRRMLLRVTVRIVGGGSTGCSSGPRSPIFRVSRPNSPLDDPSHRRTDDTAYPGDPTDVSIPPDPTASGERLALALAPLPLLAMSGCCHGHGQPGQGGADGEAARSRSGPGRRWSSTRSTARSRSRGPPRARSTPSSPRSARGPTRRPPRRTWRTSRSNSPRRATRSGSSPPAPGAKMFGSSGASVALKVPAGSTLSLTTRNGEIQPEGIRATSSLDPPMGRSRSREAEGSSTSRPATGPSRSTPTRRLVAAETSNGNVSFAGSLARGSHKLETSNGAIDLKLPASAAFQFEARTSNGSVTNRFPGLQPRSGKEGSRRLAGLVGPARRLGHRGQAGDEQRRDHDRALRAAEAPGEAHASRPPHR